MLGSFSKFCGGNVVPSRIVKLQTDDTVIHAAAATDGLFGISQMSTRRLALAGWDDGFAGIVGSPPINIFGPGDDECLLELGGTVSIGSYITSGAAGVGLASTTTKDSVIAQAKEAGVLGDLVRVKPLRFAQNI